MKKTTFTIVVWIESSRRKTSPGVSEGFEKHAAVNSFPSLLSSMFYFCTFFNTMYVVSQVGDSLFKCPLRVWVSRRRCGIVALVLYTVETFFCLKYCCAG